MFELKTQLYQHQQAAFDKLKNIRVGGLFMEMGTGKTRTAFEFVHYRKDKIANVIWFCPVTLKQTFYNELQKHTTSQNIYIFDDTTNTKNIPNAFWYIVGIESISASARVTLATNDIIKDNSFCIVDESSFIKGHNSLRTMRITRMCERAKYRMILTGTPMTLGVVDLYAQMRFLSPKILEYNSFYSFASNHLEYSDKYPGLIVRAHNTDYLSKKINPYIYQVTKDECLDLPHKTYKLRYCEPTTQQVEWYARAKQEIYNEAIDKFDSYALFKLFGALQQIASGFWNRHNITLENNRLELLKDVIKIIPESEKIIIWCKYEPSVLQIANELDVNVVYGKKTQKKRNRQLAQFEKSGRILVATMQCGGYGLNLPFVHYVIFYENSFNYAHRLQSEDRCHRIGQKHNVIYFDLFCGLNIEDYIARNIDNKGRTIDRFKSKLKAIKDDKAAIKKFIQEL